LHHRTGGPLRVRRFRVPHLIAPEPQPTADPAPPPIRPFSRVRRVRPTKRTPRPHRTRPNGRTCRRNGRAFVHPALTAPATENDGREPAPGRGPTWEGAAGGLWTGHHDAAGRRADSGGSGTW
jgi:hypothetical protein